MEKETQSHIFSGPPLNIEVFSGSFGQFVAEKLRKLPTERITHIDGDTGDTMTNGEFLKLTMKIAAGLDCLGVSAGDLVAVFGGNGFRISATTTACILLNAPIAPLDPDSKPYELTNILKKYQPNFVFCPKIQAEDILKVLEILHLKTPVILLDEDKSEDPRLLGFSVVLNENSKFIEPKAVSDPSKEVAVVIPSSGSTGSPKGVAMSHRSLIVICNTFLTKPGHRLGLPLQISSLFWISGLYSLFSTYFGQSRVFLNHVTTETILNAIKTYKPDYLFAGSFRLVGILKSPDLRPNDLSPLKAIGVGGEHLQPFVIDLMKEKINNPPPLIPRYGMTENLGKVSMYSPGTDIFSAGKIERGVNVKIVDLNSNITLGPGKTGEIRVKCEHQMLGYIGDPEATKQAFDDDGWLRTGDTGYITEDGLVYIVERMKNFFRYKGRQISPSEIEGLLMGLPGVLDVGVAGIPNDEDQYHAIALIVKSPGATITEEDVHKFVEQNLSAKNKLYGGVAFVSSIPRTTGSKKLKRHELKRLATELYHSKQIS